ncbi:metallophosphoesterase [Chelatococcus sambhunathii]|uniref:Metallophosphoesterase n=1 Tax=Chelatococcus sambhunathii TaxID=363953 RepID=A0ABU1DLH8_9HYPH|nr:metallophosphoesterase [Chelatococcus sambhunathii]MDR4308890.1 metallophosphoesterase [Chelatococcus sambhunathii]
MTRIVHLSDLHFDRVDPVIVEALKAEINDDPPDLVAVSGDLTQRAHRHEFKRGAEFLRSLRAPVLAVPGNHDISYINLVQRFADPFQRWRRYVARDLEPTWYDDTVAVLGLNTARRAALSLDWSNGRFGMRQLVRFRKRCEVLPDHLVRIVVAHHALHPPDAEPDLDIVGRGDVALDVFRELGVNLVLAGHHHRGYMRGHEPVASWTHGLLVVQASTATSTRLRGEPNAYHRLNVEADGHVEIEVRAWDGHRWREVAAREEGAPRPKRLKAPFVQPMVAEVARRANAPAGLG